MLASYVAGVIASTWPNERPHSGIAYPDTGKMARTGANPQLADLMNEAGVAICSLRPAGAVQTATVEDCRADYCDVLVARRAVLAFGWEMVLSNRGPAAADQLPPVVSALAAGRVRARRFRAGEG